MEYAVYISRYLTGENPGWDTAKNIETDFNISASGQETSYLKYKQMTGLSAKGKPRVYTESYADSDTMRVFLTSIRENTELKLTLVFTGPQRRKVYDNFYEYIKGYKIKYWDSVRKRRVIMFLSDAVEPTDDLLYGVTPYIMADFKFKNYSGDTEETTGI